MKFIIYISVFTLLLTSGCATTHKTEAQPVITPPSRTVNSVSRDKPRELKVKGPEGEPDSKKKNAYFDSMLSK